MKKTVFSIERNIKKLPERLLLSKITTGVHNYYHLNHVSIRMVGLIFESPTTIFEISLPFSVFLVFNSHFCHLATSCLSLANYLNSIITGLPDGFSTSNYMP
jgi:hypothetical protein